MIQTTAMWVACLFCGVVYTKRVSQNHSEVPEKDEDWPDLDTIIIFRDRVREKLFRLYDDLDSGRRILTRNIARTLVMTLEHEGFHVEVRFTLVFLCERALLT